MAKDVLQITIKKTKVPKNKIGLFFWKIHFRVWHIWRPKIMANIYKFLAEATFSMLPKWKQEELLRESSDFDVIVKFEQEIDKSDKNAKEDMTKQA